MTDHTTSPGRQRTAGRGTRRDDLAAVYADVVLDNLGRSYPYAAHHTQASPEDRPGPQELHPSFYSSYDWHSCVHMHWLGVSLLEHGVDADRDAALRRAIAANLTAANLAVEGAYLKDHPSWERPYGWAWLVRLAAVCAASEDAGIRGWGTALDPLVDIVAELVMAWAAKVEWPVRHGIHTNAAFGLALMLDAFRALGRNEAATACSAAAAVWFADDADWAQQWELSGQDFLSAGLAESDLMHRVLAPEEFARWFDRFLPGITAGSSILRPVRVTDETDGYMVHLHGLNLSRAGQVARILHALPVGDNSQAVAGLEEALQPLLQAGLEAVVTTEFMSSHWLASFAWDALESVDVLERAQN
jgi:hypothetical protein